MKTTIFLRIISTSAIVYSLSNILGESSSPNRFITQDGYIIIFSLLVYLLFIFYSIFMTKIDKETSKIIVKNEEVYYSLVVLSILGLVVIFYKIFITFSSREISEVLRLLPLSIYLIFALYKGVILDSKISAKTEIQRLVELEKLAELKDKGILTEEEFNTQKEKILNE